MDKVDQRACPKWGIKLGADLGSKPKCFKSCSPLAHPSIRGSNESTSPFFLLSLDLLNLLGRTGSGSRFLGIEVMCITIGPWL